MAKKMTTESPDTEKKAKTVKKTMGVLPSDGDQVKDGQVKADVDKKSADKVISEKSEKKTTRKKADTADKVKESTATVKKTRKKATKTTSDSDHAQPVLKAYWGVYNPQMVQVAQYDYAQQQEAQKVADELTEKKKAPHFVQIIKKII